MRTVKYIRTNQGFHIFPGFYTHYDYLENLKAMDKQVEAISAGFVILDSCFEDITCYGESISLGLKSLDEDTKQLKEFLDP